MKTEDRETQEVAHLMQTDRRQFDSVPQPPVNYQCAEAEIPSRFGSQAALGMLVKAMSRD